MKHERRNKSITYYQSQNALIQLELFDHKTLVNPKDNINEEIILTSKRFIRRFLLLSRVDTH